LRRHRLDAGLPLTSKRFDFGQEAGVSYRIKFLFCCDSQEDGRWVRAGREDGYRSRF
jgi:hypothetical protein